MRKTDATWFAISALAMSCAGLDRPANIERPSPQSWSGRAQHYADGSPPRVDLLARALLVGREKTPPGFAYYCYLVFADRGPKTAAIRREAALAYLNLFSDVVEARRNADVQPEDMAIILAPVHTDAEARSVLASRDPKEFLDSYNYDRAAVFVNRLGAEGASLPNISIVGYVKPLDSNLEVDPKTLWVIDLVSGGAPAVAYHFDELKKRLETGQPEVARTKTIEKVLKFFAEVGHTLAELARLRTA